ncbi:hypothetical protein [Kocuria sp.]|uniref:hypothetical protein n=1 Tax=Kocuria sp. TaxID=1871328 RepID=UPI0028A116B0|nr:hypothetical protein [Kocuria sp.]
MNWLESPEDPGELRLSYEELNSLTAGEFAVDAPRRVTVRTAGIDVPLLVVRRPDTQRLIVLNNGAVDLKRSQGRPIFQRSSWWEEIDGHQLYVCDPGTVGEGALTLNWFQFSPDFWIGSRLAVIARSIGEVLGVHEARDRLYYGSSAGGFAALVQLCADPHARAVINNAQFDWTRWYPQFVSRVLATRFDNMLAADVRRRWPHRANALEYLLRRPQGLRIDYYVNVASGYDRDIQYALLLDFIREHPDRSGEITVHHYYDPEMDHNPLPKAATLNILNFPS